MKFTQSLSFRLVIAGDVVGEFDSLEAITSQVDPSLLTLSESTTYRLMINGEMFGQSDDLIKAVNQAANYPSAVIDRHVMIDANVVVDDGGAPPVEKKAKVEFAGLQSMWVREGRAFRVTLVLDQPLDYEAKVYLEIPDNIDQDAVVMTKDGNEVDGVVFPKGETKSYVYLRWFKDGKLEGGQHGEMTLRSDHVNIGENNAHRMAIFDSVDPHEKEAAYELWLKSHEEEINNELGEIPEDAKSSDLPYVAFNDSRKPELVEGKTWMETFYFFGKRDEESKVRIEFDGDASQSDFILQAQDSQHNTSMTLDGDTFTVPPGNSSAMHFRVHILRDGKAEGTESLRLRIVDVSDNLRIVKNRSVKRYVISDN